MFVVTAHAGEADSGCLVGFATQCSIKPLRFIVILSKENLTYRVAALTRALAVHAVPDQRVDIAELFGGSTGDDRAKSAPSAGTVDPATFLSWTTAPIGSGDIVSQMDVGDHVGFVLRPFDGGAVAETILGFRAVRHITPGHAP
jgi:flavin reductase (DIM6/NTAB) family NADH-FMN oxidoreductase RutF